MYAKIINNIVEKFPYSLQELRLDYPNVSFPDIMSIDTIPDLSDFGFVYVHPSPQPEYDMGLQKLTHDGLEFVDNKWVEKWLVEDLSTEEILSFNQTQLSDASSQATKLLSETDYLDLPNTANKITNIDEIIAYRDELRKIAIKPEIYNVFPEKPQIIWNI